MSDNKTQLEVLKENKLPTLVNPAEDDIEFSRKNLYDLISKSQDAIEDALDLARQSQAPRAYEVLNALLKTASEISRDIVTLQKLKKEILERPVDIDDAKTVTNNNLFVGSTAELAKFIEEQKNK